MVFAYDSEMALQSAVELVNSAEEPDTLTTVAELDAFLSRWSYSGRRERTRAELDAVRAVRPRLRELLTADRDRAVELVNGMLEEVSLRPQLVRHDEYDWHLHAVDYDDPLATRMLVETVMAMIDVIRVDEISRLAVCADDTCEGVVLDLSRNRSRRYCSTACGNRNAVAAYRARQAD
jgi:predicted RNA-binding Zn ribbon-like protein